MFPKFRMINHRLRETPRLRRLDFGLLLLPLLLWGGIERGLRPRLTEPRCHLNPESCKIDDLWSVDRATVYWVNKADQQRSDHTQNASGLIAAGVPLAFHAGRALAGTVSPLAAAAAFGTDLVIFLQGVFINGTLNGLVRTAVQRPRPGAYVTPHENGKSESQYTSFYSGHTSFSAIAMFSLVFALLGRARSRLLPILAAIAGAGLIAATAWYRVAGGAHFPTDVLFAPIPALLITLWLALLHRPSVPAQKP